MSSPAVGGESVVLADAVDGIRREGSSNQPGEAQGFLDLLNVRWVACQ